MDTILNDNQLFNIRETLDDFKILLNRYRVIKNDEIKMSRFFVRNRNPIFDITNCKFFKTGLISESAKKNSTDKLVDDHYIQRSKAMRFIFDEIDKNENIDLDNFILMLKKYCSTVKVTKEEHSKITAIAKKNPNKLNYQCYSECDIKIDKLNKFIIN